MRSFHWLVLIAIHLDVGVLCKAAPSHLAGLFLSIKGCAFEPKLGQHFVRRMTKVNDSIVIRLPLMGYM